MESSNPKKAKISEDYKTTDALIGLRIDRAAKRALVQPAKATVEIKIPQNIKKQKLHKITRLYMPLFGCAQKVPPGEVWCILPDPTVVVRIVQVMYIRLRN